MIDCSVCLAWYIGDASSPFCDQLGLAVHDSEVWVPAVWRAERRVSVQDFEDWLIADGFGMHGKAYIVYVDGVDTGGLCGLGGGASAGRTGRCRHQSRIWGQVEHQS